jgi:hypothetical protein
MEVVKNLLALVLEQVWEEKKDQFGNVRDVAEKLREYRPKGITERIISVAEL